MLGNGGLLLASPFRATSHQHCVEVGVHSWWATGTACPTLPSAGGTGGAVFRQRLFMAPAVPLALVMGRVRGSGEVEGERAATRAAMRAERRRAGRRGPRAKPGRGPSEEEEEEEEEGMGAGSVKL